MFSKLIDMIVDALGSIGRTLSKPKMMSMEDYQKDVDRRVAEYKKEIADKAKK